MGFHKAAITLGTETFDIELTLANRDGMDFRMLLGREAMRNRFLVDPSKRYLKGAISDEKLFSMYSYLMHKKSGLRKWLSTTFQVIVQSSSWADKIWDDARSSFVLIWNEDIISGF